MFQRSLQNILIILCTLIVIISIGYCTFHFNKRIKPSGNVAVIGNGNISENDRNKIQSAQYIIRFNDMKNYKQGERIDAHFSRKIQDNGIYPGRDLIKGVGVYKYSASLDNDICSDKHIKLGPKFTRILALLYNDNAG